MKKEPLTLYIFRFLMGAALLAFMFMLYWSSLLIEERMQGLSQEMVQLRREIGSMKFQRVTDRDRASAEKTDRGHLNASLPNLLEKDSFYAETLPDELLPKDFVPHGVLKSATVGRPDDLHPFSNWSQVSSWQGLCNVTAARNKFGIFETFAPNMAFKIEERMREDTGTPDYWVHLRENVFWQPLSEAWFSEGVKLAPFFLKPHPVTAHDYKFQFDAMMNPANQEAGAVAARTYYTDVEEVEVVDDLTFRVRWKAHQRKLPDGTEKYQIQYVAKQLTGSLAPLASFVYQYFPDGTKIIEDDSAPSTYRTNSVWAQNFMEHWARNVIVSCGAWIFDGMSDEKIQFKRNSDHYFPLDALIQKLEVAFKNAPEGIWQDFKSNRISTHALQPDQLVELEQFLESDLYRQQKHRIERLDYLARSYYYIGWNNASPYFNSKKVRQAMTIAINRERIIQQNLNGMGVQITGGIYYNSPSYNHDIQPWPFNLDLARRMLSAEGWYDSDGDGILDKEIDGERIPFRFTLTYYVKNPTTKAIAEFVATSLKEVGIDCSLSGVDMADLSAAFEDKSFDAISLGWGLGSPPEDPKQLWHSSGAKERGSSNAVGFQNKEADKIIEELQFEENTEKRLALYHRFHEILHEEQPYTFLYTPKVAFLYRDYVRNVFVPAERQDLIPGANVGEPSSSIFWLDDPP